MTLSFIDNLLAEFSCNGTTCNIYNTNFGERKLKEKKSKMSQGGKITSNLVQKMRHELAYMGRTNLTFLRVGNWKCYIFLFACFLLSN